MNRSHVEYAMYKGDQFMAIGTIPELSQKFKLAKRTLKGYTAPSHIKKATENTYILIKVEE